jgi:hypothetical protein
MEWWKCKQTFDIFEILSSIEVLSKCSTCFPLVKRIFNATTVAPAKSIYGEAIDLNFSIRVRNILGQEDSNSIPQTP